MSGPAGESGWTPPPEPVEAGAPPPPPEPERRSAQRRPGPLRRAWLQALRPPPGRESGVDPRLLLLAAGLVAGVLVLAVLAVIDGSGGPARPTLAAAPSTPFFPTGPATDSTTAGPTSSSSSTASASPTTTAGVTVEAARAVVIQYIDDVNARDRAGAAALICASNLAQWQQNATSSNGDFSYTVTNLQYLGSQLTASGSIVVAFHLTFSDGTSSSPSFTVVSETGPKICTIGQS